MIACHFEASSNLYVILNPLQLIGHVTGRSGKNLITWLASLGQCNSLTGKRHCSSIYSTLHRYFLRNYSDGEDTVRNRIELRRRYESKYRCIYQIRRGERYTFYCLFQDSRVNSIKYNNSGNISYNVIKLLLCYL